MRTLAIAALAGLLACGSEKTSSPPGAGHPAPTAGDPSSPVPAGDLLDPVALVDARAACTDDAGCAARCGQKISAACRELSRLRHVAHEPLAVTAERGCTLGDGRSCLLAAKIADTMAAHGRGAARPELRARARELDQASCDAGDPDACRDLLAALDEAHDPAVDRMRIRTCVAGDAIACVSLGDTDAAHADAWRRHAVRVEAARCAAGDTGRCANAVAIATGDALISQRPPLAADAVRRVADHVRGLLEPRCAHDDGAACYQLAGVAVLTGADADARAAMARADRAWAAACDRHDLDACSARAEAFAPSVPSLEAWPQRLLDPARGREAWAAACTEERAHGDGGIVLCEQARQQGADVDPLAPPPPPPPPPPP